MAFSTVKVAPMELVRNYIAENGCSVKGLAKMAKIHQSGLQRAVSGQRKLSGESAIRLSQVIGVDPLELRPDLRIEIQKEDR